MTPQTRTVTFFAVGGTIGPLLIPVLSVVGLESSFYRPLYLTIATLCPAWLFGALEYNFGTLLTGFVVLAVNVLLWSALGLAFGFRGSGPLRFGLASLTSMLFAACSYWLTNSLLAPVGLLLVFGALFLMATRGKLLNAA